MRNRADKKLQTDRQADSYIPPKQSFGGYNNQTFLMTLKKVLKNYWKMRKYSSPTCSPFLTIFKAFLPIIDRTHHKDQNSFCHLQTPTIWLTHYQMTKFYTGQNFTLVKTETNCRRHSNVYLKWKISII